MYIIQNLNNNLISALKKSMKHETEISGVNVFTKNRSMQIVTL